MTENASAIPGLRIGHVAGVGLNKWRGVWAERFDAPLTVEDVPDTEQVSALHERRVDMCFVRLPIDRDGLHAIPLYEEQMVAWVSKEHVFAAVDDVTMADLSGEQVLTELDGAATDLVLGGAVLLVPMSIARGASRRDLTHRPVTDAEPSPVALAWRVDNDNPLIDEFIGVVRGRTANSSRGQTDRSTSASGADGSSEKGSPKNPAKKPGKTPANTSGNNSGKGQARSGQPRVHQPRPSSRSKPANRGGRRRGR